MKIDLNQYNANKKFIQTWYLTKGKGNPRKAMGTLAMTTFVPIIVVAYYIGEVCDWHPDVIEAIKEFVKFYKYTEVINKPNGSP